MIVIADTGPINYLVVIGEIDILPKLYRRILVPNAVCEELSHELAPKPVQVWIARPPDWLEARTPRQAPDIALLRARLGPGQRDAILLAEEINADELIIDDLRGRQEAERRHLHFIGTIGVLRAAAGKGLLDFKSAIDRLRQTNFHIAQEILDRLLKDD